MASTSPDSIFAAAVKEKHEQAIERLDACQRALILDDRDTKVEAAKELALALNQLADILPAAYRPRWVVSLRDAANGFASWPAEEQFRVNLYDEIAVGGLRCRRHEWDFSRDGVHEPINFNGVAQESRSESKIPDLFDLLIDQLEACITNDYVDSVRARAAVERLLATLKAKESRTFFGMVTTGRFAQRFIRVFLLGELKKIPVAGGIIDALEKTADQLAEEDRKLLERVNQKTQAIVQAEWESLPIDATTTVEILELPAFSSEVHPVGDGDARDGDVE